VTPSVTGFVVISAWFGVSFKPSKVLRLVGVAAWCSVAVACYFQKNIALGCFQTYWFLWAYVLMMLFAPLVESAVLNRKTVVPVAIAIFCWGFLLDMPWFRDWMPRTGGLTAHTGWTLIGIYVVVRALKRTGVLEKMSTKCLVWGVLVSAVLCECGCYRYNSLTSLSLVLGLFLLVLRMPQMPRVGKVAAGLSPSLFAVYMYHTGAGFNVLKALEDYFILDVGMNVYVTHVLTALIVFWGCILIDLPRRALCRIFKPLINRSCQWMDSWYERMVGVGGW